MAKEWYDSIVNCCTGCAHGCLYCYSRLILDEHGHKDWADWTTEQLRPRDVDKGYKKRRGVVMFPSSHDITPTNFRGTYLVLMKLVHAGNKVLIVTKPHYDIITVICDSFVNYVDNIMFRFTIGSMDDNILSACEPFAPNYLERKRCLMEAFDRGFNTSVSVEPMLDLENIDGLVNDLLPYITHTIWIGKLNYVYKLFYRTAGDIDFLDHLARINREQSDNNIIRLWCHLESEEKTRWKSSIRKIVDMSDYQESDW